MNDQHRRRTNEREPSRGDFEGATSGRDDYEYDQRGRRPMSEPAGDIRNDTRRELGSGWYGPPRRSREDGGRHRGREWDGAGERERWFRESVPGPETWRGYGFDRYGFGQGSGSDGRAGARRSGSYDTGEGADYGRQSYGSGFRETASRRAASLTGSAGNTGRFAGKGPKGYRRSDERIKEQVSERLEEHGGVDASEITVQVKDGEVTLDGTVPDRSMKRMAEDAVERCPGVQEVQNRLRVERGNGPESSRWSDERSSSSSGSSMGSMGSMGSRRASENPRSRRSV